MDNVKIYNRINCRKVGNNSGGQFAKLFIHKLGKFTITNPVCNKLQSNYIAIVEKNCKLYITTADSSTGFELRGDGKEGYKRFHNREMYRVFNKMLYPPQGKLVKTVSLAVDIDADDSVLPVMLEINITEPIRISYEYDPDPHD